MNFFKKQPEMPMGLGMALMKNPDALKKYSRMSYEQKKAVIENTHNIVSKEDMENYVNSLRVE